MRKKKQKKELSNNALTLNKNRELSSECDESLMRAGLISIKLILFWLSQSFVFFLCHTTEQLLLYMFSRYHLLIHNSYRFKHICLFHQHCLSIYTIIIKCLVFAYFLTWIYLIFVIICVIKIISILIILIFYLYNLHIHYQMKKNL